MKIELAFRTIDMFSLSWILEVKKTQGYSFSEHFAVSELLLVLCHVAENLVGHPETILLLSVYSSKHCKLLLLPSLVQNMLTTLEQKQMHNLYHCSCVYPIVSSPTHCIKIGATTENPQVSTFPTWDRKNLISPSKIELDPELKLGYIGNQKSVWQNRAEKEALNNP